MLVLSRKENEVVLFPNLGISVRINRIEGNKVRVGIDAPRDVPVLRGELDSGQPFAEPASGDGKSVMHALRNELNSIHLALHILQGKLDAGQLDHADETLECALRSLEALDQRMEHGNSQVSQMPQGRRRLALLVEDDANERALFAGMLEMHGYDVYTATDGEEALQYLADHDAPDLVLLDINMPRMNGRDTAQAIRVDPRLRGLKIFAVSGEDRQDYDCGDQFFDNWFQKPIRPQEFADQLERELAAYSV